MRAKNGAAPDDVAQEIFRSVTAAWPITRKKAPVGARAFKIRILERVGDALSTIGDSPNQESIPHLSHADRRGRDRDRRHRDDGGCAMIARVDPDRVDFAAVKEATLRALDFIIPRLLPGGKRVGDEWVARNPTRTDSKPGSFSVNMKTGVWADFATADKGGDMIDLYVYLNGGTNIQAKNALADMLNVQASGGSASKNDTSKKSAASTAAPADSRVPPPEFPPRTPPDENDKPAFIVAGDDGPAARGNEKRRHVYRRGGVPVRIKIINNSIKSRAFNAYRVTDVDGATGWQFKRPEGFEQIPYFVASADPFSAVINEPIFWTEGEKDVETVAILGGKAFTFGGCGDGLPAG
jgi:putative DNA primase/helicase